MSAWKVWVVAFLAMWTSSCFEAMRWESQDIHLKYDVENDTAHVLLVYEGVFAGKPEGDEFETAVKAVKAIAAKERYFALIDWPVEIDLDSSVHENANREMDDASIKNPDAPEVKVYQLARALEVADAQVFLDHQSKLVIIQELRLPRFSRFLDAVSSWLSHEIANDMTPGASFSATEWAAWRAKAARNEPWLRATRTSLEFRAPYGPHWLAESVKGFVSSQPFGPGFAGALSELAFENGEVVFRGSADESGAIHFHFGPPHGEPHEYDEALKKRLEADGMKFRSNLADELVARFRR